jgi:hypothetical protein
MIGLFLDHAGITTNIPSARFGNISMLPNERAKLKQSTGYRGVSYILDMHSRTGFSGSPVFVYRTFGSDLTNLFGHEFEQLKLSSSKGSSSGTLRVRTLFNFLGIHWAQFPEEMELRSKSHIKQARKNSHVLGESYIEGMGGMTCVIPGWQVLEVLDMPKFKNRRRDAAREAGPEPRGPKPERATPQPNDANPNHREDFTRLLDAAVRKPPQED